MSLSPAQPQAVAPAKLDHPWHPQCLLVYGSSVLWYTIVYVLGVVMPVYLWQLGADASFIGIIGGLNMLAATGIRPLAGRWIDRFGARPVFVGSLLGMALSMAALVIPATWALASSRIIQGIATATFSTSLSLITVQLLSERARGEGMSVYSLSTILPSTFGPALGLYLINDHSMASIVILVLGIAVLNLIFGARLTVPQRPAHQQPEQTSASHEQRGMWWAALLIPSAVILLASMSVGAFITFLPLYLGAASSGLASGFFAAKAVLMVSGRFIGRRWTSAAHAQWVVVGSVVAAALAPALLLASDAPALVLLAGMVHGLAFALLYPTLLTEVSFAVPTRQQGFGVGIFIGAADLGVALGSLALGVVAQYWSYGAVFGASAFAALLALALLGCRSLVTKLPPVAQAD